jgi:hypothetical protein
MKIPTKRYMRFSIMIPVLMIIGMFWWFIWSNESVVGYFNVGSPEAQGVVPVYLVESAGGNIRYGYGIELPTRFAGAMVEYNHQTLEGINEYAALNQSHRERLVKAADADDYLAVRATFNRPFSQAEFTAFVEQYQMQADSYVIWIENDDGTTTTILGGPSETELIPGDRFDDTLTVAQSHGGQTPPGWVEVEGTVPASLLPELADDSRVFLADVMTAVIQEQFTDAVMKEAGIPRAVRTAVLREGLEVNRPIYLAWAIRNLGLMADVPQS